eukprot:scaffold323383_cov31-Tisochrysis_lutea.AAC.1
MVALSRAQQARGRPDGTVFEARRGRVGRVARAADGCAHARHFRSTPPPGNAVSWRRRDIPPALVVLLAVVALSMAWLLRASLVPSR